MPRDTATITVDEISKDVAAQLDGYVGQAVTPDPTTMNSNVAAAKIGLRIQIAKALLESVCSDDRERRLIEEMGVVIGSICTAARCEAAGNLAYYATEIEVECEEALESK